MSLADQGGVGSGSEGRAGGRDRVVVVGDIINDIVAVPRGPIRSDTDNASTIRQKPGGSAANTAGWLGSLGVPVDIVGAVGSNDAAMHEEVFREGGVTPHLQVEFGVPTGTIVIIVDGERRTMYTERGANALLIPASVTDELLTEAALLHISAYSFLDGFGIAGAQELIVRANAAGVRVAINPGSSGYIADFGAQRFLDAIAGAHILFPNLAEATLLTGETNAERAAKALLDYVDTVVLTLGGEGSIVAGRSSAVSAIPAPRVRIVDPTGAGDAFAAGFIQHWLRGDDLRAAAAAGTMVAARAIMMMGGRPPL